MSETKTETVGHLYHRIAIPIVFTRNFPSEFRVWHWTIPPWLQLQCFTPALSSIACLDAARRSRPHRPLAAEGAELEPRERWPLGRRRRSPSRWHASSLLAVLSCPRRRPLLPAKSCPATHALLAAPALLPCWIETRSIEREKRDDDSRFGERSRNKISKGEKTKMRNILGILQYSPW